MTDAPTGSNADKWALFLSEWGTAYCAVRIAEAIEVAEQRGYARGIREAEKACVGEYLEDEASTEDDAAYDRAVADCIMAVRALSPTPPAPVTVQEAAKAWKAARETAMKDVTPETFTELSKAESALSRAIAELKGENQ